MISIIKKIYFIALTLSLTAITSNCQQSNLNQDENMAVKIADSFIELHPDTVAYKTEAKSYRWDYEQGLMLEGFYQLYKLTDDEKYFDYIQKNIDYYVEKDGNIKTYNMNDFNIDNISPGRVLLHLYTETKNDKYKKAADTLIKQLENHPRTSEGGFWHKKIYPNQMWLDGLYMAEPFYTRYAVLFDENEILDDVMKQFLLIEKNLKDKKTGLYYHGWDERREQKWADPNTGRSPNYWGRAIGWFMMALVDVLDYFPEEHSGREKILNIFQNLSKSLLNYRDEKTKLWWQIVDQGSREGNYIEASSSSMFIYSLAKGANKGYLEKKYFDIARESFKALLNELVTYDDEGHFYLKNIASVGGLGGNPYRDGSFEYYISEPKEQMISKVMVHFYYLQLKFSVE